jgi:hypothetical protein
MITATEITEELIREVKKGRLTAADARERFRAMGIEPTQSQDRALLTAEATRLLKSAQ